MSFLAQAGNEQPENIVVEVDLERSENVRRWWPFLRDRRIDAYEGLTKRFFRLRVCLNSIRKEFSKAC